MNIRLQVVVECLSTDIEQIFPCNRWLPEDEDDHRIERRLQEDESLGKTCPLIIPWYRWIYTSDIKEADTDAQVNLVIYGHNGKSDNIKL
ncbi:unnamed protein product [Rotaria sp. Silwood2]|nr:unnamed protein product [Rotaria sp. Silwood2]CAF4542215.1 unnamed protein product [Rotaria sp. Silwood2]